MAVLAALVLLGAAVIDAGPAAASAPPPIRVDGRTLAFGSVLVGTTSPAQALSITNAGSSPATGLHIGAPTDPAFHVASTTCGSTLAAGASCQAMLTYTPTGVLEQFAGLRVASAGGGAVHISMNGQPDSPAFPFRVSPTALDFGPRPVATTSATQSVVVTNASASNYSFVATNDGSGPFMMTTTCAGSPKFLQHGGSCSFTYSLKPTTTGDIRFDTALHLAIVSGPSATFPLTLKGHGGTAGQLPLRATSTRLDFGNVAIGATSASQSATITNVGTSPVSMTFQGGAPAGDFHASFLCPETLAGGASCSITYTAQPLAPGLRSARANFTIVVPGFDHREVPIVLTAHGGGTGARPVASPTYLDLGTAAAGHSTPTAVVRLRNTGNGPMTGMSLMPPGTAVPQITTTGSTCGATLAAGAACTYGFRYSPNDALQHYASYTIQSSSPPISLTLLAGPTAPVHEAFVFSAYLDFIGRPPTDAERSSTAAALDSGATTRRAVITSLAGSQERVTKIVQSLYSNTLGRPGDPGGVSYWVGQIRSGTRTVAQVAAQLYASDEYFTHLGGGTNATWVSDLYVKLLGRPADAGGRDYWAQETVAHGRVNVAGRFFESLESRHTRVSRLYQSLLGRDPDPSGRDHWASEILTKGDIVLAVELASSIEYLVRTNTGEGLG